MGVVVEIGVGDVVCVGGVGVVVEVGVGDVGVVVEVGVDGDVFVVVTAHWLFGSKGVRGVLGGY